jgi:ankyrin repeat protein
MIGQSDNTALTLAAARGKASMVTLLLDKGANINHCNQVRHLS